MRKELMDSIERSGNSVFVLFAINRWLALRLDFLCAIFGFSTAVFAVYLKGKMESELLAFAIQITVDVVLTFSVAIRMVAEV